MEKQLFNMWEGAGSEGKGTCTWHLPWGPAKSSHGILEAAEGGVGGSTKMIVTQALPRYMVTQKHWCGNHTMGKF